jgi:hypothetical protein
MKMRRSMFVFRVITTTNLPARKTKPQMHPIIPSTQTLFAASSARDQGPNLIKMSASLYHDFP